MMRFVLGVAATALIAVGLIYVGFVQPRLSGEPIELSDLRAKYAAPDSQYAEIDGLEVHFRDEGEGPAIVMYNGSFGNARTFDPIVDALKDRFRVIRFDLPPYGLSGPLPEVVDTSWAKLTAGLLDYLGVETTAALGMSSGGIMAYHFAAAYPERVTKLLLFNTPPSAPVNNAAARAKQSALSRLSLSVCGRADGPWGQVCWRDMLRTTFYDDSRVTPALAEEYYDMNRSATGRQASPLVPLMREDDKVIAQLAAVRAPTLIAWGQHSLVLPPETALTLQERLTGTETRLIRLEDTGHYPPLESPELAIPIIAQFMETGLSGF